MMKKRIMTIMKKMERMKKMRNMERMKRMKNMFLKGSIEGCFINHVSIMLFPLSLSFINMTDS
jgi:hypothetical protein